MDSFANRLKSAMDARGFKQADLVAKTGIGKSSISTYLSGEYEPKQRNIYKIASALDINEAWLLGYDDIPMERPAYRHPGEMGNGYVHWIERKNDEAMDKLPISIKEKILLEAYRAHPEMQSAVDRLLGISENDVAEIYAVRGCEEDRHQVDKAIAETPEEEQNF